MPAGRELVQPDDFIGRDLWKHVRAIGRLAAPNLASLMRGARQAWGSRGFTKEEINALNAVALGSLTASGSLAAFRVYQGNIHRASRQLAERNIHPHRFMEALQVLDDLMEPVLSQSKFPHPETLKAVRECLHLFLAATLQRITYEAREADRSTLDSISLAEMEESTVAPLLRRCLDALVSYTGAAVGHAFLADRRKLTLCSPATAGRTRTSEVSMDLSDAIANRLLRCSNDLKSVTRLRSIDNKWRKRFRACWSFPLCHEDQIIGMFQFGFAEKSTPTPRQFELLKAASSRCAATVHKIRLMNEVSAREQRMRDTAYSVLQIEELERRRISKELHDDTAQNLAVVRLQMEMIEMDLQEQDPIRARLAEPRNLTEQIILEVRRLISDLSPAVLEQLGLPAALRQLAARFRKTYECAIHLQIEDTGVLRPDLEIVTYRVAQECLLNIRKHSKATEVKISLDVADKILRLVVEDNGVGFHVDPGHTQNHPFGLVGMRERVTLVGGQFSIGGRQSPRTGRAKSGTRITMELPVSERSP